MTSVLAASSSSAAVGAGACWVEGFIPPVGKEAAVSLLYDALAIYLFQLQAGCREQQIGPYLGFPGRFVAKQRRLSVKGVRLGA